MASKLNIQDLIGNKREAILQLAAQYGVSDVRVFGSAARGEASEDSDLDFLVKFPADTSIFDVVGFWLDLKALLGREIDLLTDHPSGGQLMQIAREEAVSL
ncbi:MAG: nucleotidyltransferase family protein [Chloroflexi bacterium]|nr:nucleotidyltransferase family protein [Chloroflexota bacterium]